MATSLRKMLTITVNSHRFGMFGVNKSKCILNRYYTTSYTQSMGRNSPISLDERFSRLSPPYSVVFMGTDEFASGILQSLFDIDKNNTKKKLFSSIDVVCPEDKITGKGVLTEMPVKTLAKKRNLDIYEIGKEGLANWNFPVLKTQETEAVATAEPLSEKIGFSSNSNKSKSTRAKKNNSYAYDIAIVASFGYYLPSRVLDSVRLALNVHPSLLPMYRGSAPIYHTLLNGDKMAGCSIIEVSKKKMDAGKILWQSNIEIPKGCMYEELHDQLAIMGSVGLKTSLLNLKTTYRRAAEQNEEEATLASKVTKKMAEINWEKDFCKKIECTFRALDHKYPLRTYWSKKKRMVLLSGYSESVTHLNTSVKIIPGAVAYAKKLLYIRCADGWVGFSFITLAGKEKIHASKFHGDYMKRTRADVYFSSKESEHNQI